MRRTALAPLLVFVSSCGGLNYYEDGSSGDAAGADDGAAADAQSDADTDADSDADADGDADTDVDTEDTPTDTGPPPIPCGNFPNVPDPSLAAGGNVDPALMAIYVNGIVDAGTIQDYIRYDVAGGVPLGDSPAILAFEFLDAAQAHICTVTYDLSQISGPGGAWKNNAPVTLFDAWDLNLTGAETDCGPLAARFPVNTAPALVETYTWNIGFGPMTPQFVNTLQPLVDASAGGNWAADYDPYVFSLFVNTNVFGSLQTQEWNYVFELERTCENLHVDDNNTPADTSDDYGFLRSVPGGGQLTGYENAISFVLVAFNF